MAWQNGLGQTAEVARFPATATPFEWRISIAQVTGNNPFSLFPGVDRTIVQLTGPAMTLTHPTLNHHETLQPLTPYAFSGDVETSATVAGPATDFNVMVRRGIWHKAVESLHLQPQQPMLLERREDMVAVYCAKGDVHFKNQTVTLESLSQGDCILFNSIDLASFAMETSQPTTLIVARLSKI